MNTDRAILVVEDDANDALLFQCALSKAGLHGPVTFVSDGGEAKEYLLGLGQYSDRTRYPLPEMIVVDLVMPRFSGFQLVEWVRARPEFDGVFIVVLTGFDQRTWMTKAYELGANLYLVKPMRLSELAGVIACAAIAGDYSHMPPRPVLA